MGLKKNINTQERTIRIMLGCAILAYPDDMNILFYMLGSALVLSGLLSYCPLSHLVMKAR